MTKIRLIEHARAWPIFSFQDCAKWFPDDRRSALALGLSRYAASELIIRLRRGLYLLNQEQFPDSYAIASRLDRQMVISVETALHCAGIIPEIPFATSAVTPAITSHYHPQIGGTFIFRHMKLDLFFGFHVEEHTPYAVRVAYPEKALLDLFWFHRFEHDKQGYISELRLDIPQDFSWKRFREYTRLFDTKEMNAFADIFSKNFS